METGRGRKLASLEYVRAINGIQDGVIGQLHARVRALEEQLQQPVVQAERV